MINEIRNYTDKIIIEKSFNEMTYTEKKRCFDYALKSGEYHGDYHNFQLAMSESLFDANSGKIIECH